MPREGLPFKTVGEPKLFSDQGGVSDIFEFTPEKGKEYVYKEVRPDSRAFMWYGGENLEETAAVMNKAYQILKRHLGEYLVPTHFLIAENKAGNPCIMLAQEKIDGETVAYRKLPPSEVYRELAIIEQKAKEAEDDPELIKLLESGKLGSLFKDTTENFFCDVNHAGNQIIDKSGRVRIVDW